MKTIRSLMTLAGLSLVLLALGVTGAKAQNLATTSFNGTFTLPVPAQWGRMSLPAGHYSLQYGQPFRGGTDVVVISDQKGGISHGMILAQSTSSASTDKNQLVCVREGNGLVVRELEIGALGTSVAFAMPPGTELTAQRHSGSKNVELAEAPMLIQRIQLIQKTN